LRTKWTQEDESRFLTMQGTRLLADVTYTTAEAAKILGISRKTVWTLCVSGKLLFYRLNGNSIGVVKQSVRDYQEQRGTKTGRGHYRLTKNQKNELENLRRIGEWPSWAEDRDMRIRAVCRVCGQTVGTEGKRGEVDRYPVLHYPPRSRVMPGMVRRRCEGMKTPAIGWGKLHLVPNE